MSIQQRGRILVGLLSLILSAGFYQSQAQCCQYKLNMLDSYGDGWNGGFLQVFINNNLLGIFSATNNGSLDSFQVCNGDTLKLEYTAGSYENENTYQLYDPGWNLIFKDGPDPLVGIVFDTIGNCAFNLLAGNNPCTAIPIDTAQCLWSDNTSYSGSGIVPNCANYQGGDVWFEAIVPPSGNMVFATDSGTINDTGLAVWGDSLCTNIQLLGCDDDSGNGLFSSLTLYGLNPGKKVFIQVYGYGTSVGTFRLCVNDLGIIKIDSTELPLVFIQTQGQPIGQDTKVDALMDIKFNGIGNITYYNGPSNVYSGNIGIEIRGASSSGYPQKPFNIETRTASGQNNNVSLLGMPQENDWVLLSNFNDRSLIRNTLAFKLFADMGNVSCRASLCEVLIDSSYNGIYVLAEKIKPDSARVDIADLLPVDTLGDQLTGGYILQQNLWDNSNSFQSNYSPIDHPTYDVHFVYQYPSPNIIHPKQKTYIASFIDSLEDALYSSNFTDSTLGYRAYLDTKSFIDYFIVNELSRNNDGFKKSVFFHKDKNSKGGKLKAGPVWDFDWAWKTMATCSLFDQFDGSGWAHRINDCPTDNYSCGYYIRLMQDSNYNNELRCAYENYRTSILDTNTIFNYIDSVGNLVQNAQARHFKRWALLGVSGPAPEVGAIATTYAAELDTLKQWIKVRLQWLDANIPGKCIKVPTSVANEDQWMPLKYYPNPSTGTIYFEGDLPGTADYVLNIYTMTSQRIAQKSLKGGRQKFSYSVNQKGLYYFTITRGLETIQYGKMTIH